MRPVRPSLLPPLLCCCALALGLPACGGYCDRDDSADGSYGVVTDCSGVLKQGKLIVGASPGVESGFILDGSGDACATTVVTGTEELGLPGETVTVEGKRRFSLSGMVRGQNLSCASENFGSEDILFCRTSDGALACVAFVD